MLFLASCHSSLYFKTPNNLRMHGTLFLMNGKSYEGRLVVNTRNTFGSKVKLYQPDDKKPMHFTLTDIKGYQIRNDYYALKQVAGNNPLFASREYLFMRQLTDHHSLIHLFERTEVVSNSKETNTRIETQYYLQLPGEKGDAVWALNSHKLVPDFDEKMSKIVSDCPDLAKKIASKEAGYFYAQVSLFKEKRAAVLMHIIDEYNSCRAAGQSGGSK